MPRSTNISMILCRRSGLLSCNDENPIITYKGIAARIGITEADAQRLVGAHRELFRPGMRPHRLSSWKERMKAGKGLPGWLLEIVDPVERTKMIDALSPDDVFRNQFRVEDGARKCSIEIINWGLNHIDLMEKRAATVREEKVKEMGNGYFAGKCHSSFADCRARGTGDAVENQQRSACTQVLRSEF